MMISQRIPSALFPIMATVLLLLAITAEAAPAAAQQGPSVAVQTAVVIRAPVSDILHAYGTLQADPDQVLALSLPHAGLISKVWVRLGQRVTQGDPLLEVVTAPEARMQFLQAQSAVDFAQRELQRNLRLFKEQLATKAQVEAARKSLSDAQASLTALQQRGVSSQKEVLRAVRDGIVTRLDVTLGQRVPADTTAMLIAAENRLVAILGVEPEDLAKVKAGLPVVLQSVFVPDTRIPTQVREVHAMIDPATHLVEVLAPIPDDAVDHLVLGSRVRARIEVTRQNALVVPRSAVLSDQGEDYLFVVRDGHALRRVVKTGLPTADGGRIAVSGDIQVGDRVVISGNYELDDGMTVRESH